MKRMLIVLLLNFLVQFNAFADSPDSPNISFMKNPTGASLLSVIDDSEKESTASQHGSFTFLIGYLVGISDSTGSIISSVYKLAVDSDQATKKRAAGGKLTKEESERAIRLSGAKSVAPIRLTMIPDGVTYGQKIAIIKKFLLDHPEKLHEPAYTLVVQALSDAFKDSQ